MRQFRQEREYEAIRRCVQEQGYPVEAACLTLHVSRAGYYRWRSGRVSIQSAENRRIAGIDGNGQTELVHAITGLGEAARIRGTAVSGMTWSVTLIPR